MRRLLILLLAYASAPASAHAQATRVRAVVEYIAGADIYLSVGTSTGLLPGDTLPVRFAETEPAKGVFLVRSATRGRSVAGFAGRPFPVTRGQALLLELPAGRMPPAAAPPDSPPGQAPPPLTPAATRTAAVRRRTARASGFVGADVDAVSWTDRAGAAFGGARRFATPSARLSLRITDLPGGLQASTSVRSLYRYGEATTSTSAATVHVYEAALRKEFERLPLRLAAGRFYNTYEPYSGYWDGALARVGGQDFGIGGVAGYAPAAGNEGFSMAVPKLTGFLDLRREGEQVGYAGDLSYHWVGGEAETARRALGWSQRLRLGGLRLHQRLQLSRTSTGTAGAWELADLQLGGRLDTGTPLSLHARFARRTSTLFPVLDTALLQRQPREHIDLGLSLNAAAGGISADVGRVTDPDGTETRTLGGSYYLAGPLPASGSVTYWSSPGSSALYVSQGLSRAIGRSQLRADYSYYRTSGEPGRARIHGVQAGGSFPLAVRLRGTARWDVRWGDTPLTYHVLGGLLLSF